MRDITLADTVYLTFTTRAFATGAPTVLAGTPVVSAYENNSGTQITAGITLGVSHDSVVGLNLLTVVASGANGYENGKDYSLVITTGTVDGVSVVGEVVGEFTIGRSAAAVDLANGTDGLGAIKAETELIVADTNELQVDNVPGLIATAQSDLDIITGASGVNLLTATQASIDAIEADTNELQTDDVPSLIAALNNITVADIMTTAQTESYAVDGATLTLAQFMNMVWSLLAERVLDGTTLRAKKLDGTTDAMTFALDAADPTTQTRNA